ncbi:hypothetical protein [uncultured Roseibium sp.]|uniref:hypothetical protein n=1 Tax=uncultured Roseibium sp. TaxID=1936171 RepID=UPI00261EDC19|nr:hypothetical protein [uncultured Roseibium sp.]
MKAYTEFAFVFVHSYSSAAGNWLAVMEGTGSKMGRLPTAFALAEAFSLSVVADDAIDSDNQDLLRRWRVENFGRARNTRDEILSALAEAGSAGVIFVSSPDHLPRVVREALTAREQGCLFAASEVPFSDNGPAAVKIEEPPHELISARCD